MLFIWDLHIKTDKKKEIFSKLDEIILNTDKENIIFLGDYIYHFAYNPKVLWEFFDLLLNYSQNWKKIYILAGNHDYIKWHFIFSEAEKLANFTWTNQIKIISQPNIEEINWKKILFFPFYTRIAQEEEFSITDKKIKKYSWENLKLFNNLFFIAYQNFKQENKNQKISWTINLDLLNFLIDENPEIIVHHFYIANTAFPGQFAKFNFKSIALSEEIFNWPGEIVSWHLHKAFKHKNYTCVGSFWNTSPLEENDTKVVYYYPNKFKQVIINPYISLQEDELENLEENIKTKWENIIQEMETLLNNKIETENLDFKKINLIIKSEKFIDLKEKIPQNLLDKFESIQLRQINKKNIENILNELKTNKENLSYSIESWKQLVKEYIEKKYPDKKEEYFKILEELEII